MPPRQVQGFGFPVGGLSENYSFESQEPGTTVSALNVRAYDAKSGRLRGGQRPGLKKYVASKFSLTNSAGTNPKAFQSLVQLTGTDVSKSVGDKAVAMSINSSSESKVEVFEDFPGLNSTKTPRHLSTLLDTQTPSTFDGAIQMSVYGRNSDLYTATVDKTADSGKYWVYLHKSAHYSGSGNISAVKLGYIDTSDYNATHRYVIGMGHYSGSLYLFIKGTFTGATGAIITSGTESNCVLKIKDDLTLLEAKSSSFASGNGDDHSLTNNLLAVGQDRLVITAGSAGSVTVKCWRLGIQAISDPPTTVTVDTTGSTSSRYELEMDNRGGTFICYKMDSTYYVSKVHRDFSGLDASFATSGKKTATNTLSSLSYCHRTDRLGVAGTRGATGLFSGVGCEVCLLDPGNGNILAPTKSQSRLVSGVSDWSCIRAKGDGEFHLFRLSSSTVVTTATTTNVYAEYLVSDNDWDSVTGTDGNSSNKTYTVSDSQASDTNRSGADRAVAVFSVFDLDFGEKSTARQSYLVGVGEGTVRVMQMHDDTSKRNWVDVSAGTNALEHSSPVIFGIPFYGTVLGTEAAHTEDAIASGVRKPRELPVYGAFFVDGFNKKYYDFFDNKVKGWSSNSNISGSSFPVDSGGYFPNLIEKWRGRIVMSGLPNEPHNWFMTSTGTSDNWQYFPTIVNEYTATAGHVSDAGEMPDIVRGMIPLTDDVLLFLGDKSIWQLSGDPMSGGRWDLVSDKAGGAWGRAWCIDSLGIAYFFGSTGGVYRMLPRSIPERITTGVIDKRLRDIDLSNTIVRMEWNEKEMGIHLTLTKNDTTSAEDCYFYDARSGSWWPDKFSHIAHNTANITVYDGDASGDREVLLGGRDGNVYYFDPSQARDQTDTGNQDISSHVYLGPLSPSAGKVVVDEVQSKIALDSGTVKWALHAGSSAEAALPTDVILSTDTSGTTRGQVGTGDWSVTTIDGEKVGKSVDRMRAVGDAFYLKLLGDASPSDRWAFETIAIQYHPVGRQSSRSL